jgi:hypothetical protein
MKFLNLNENQPPIVHECTVIRVGEWAIFKCPHCLDYERKINLITGAMKTRAAFNAIRHQGNYAAPGLDAGLLSLN